MGHSLALLLRVPEHGHQPADLEGPGEHFGPGVATTGGMNGIAVDRLIGETEDFPVTLGPFIQRPRVHGGVVHDARVAAVCVAHGVEVLLSRDRDLMLFPELRIRDPFRGTDALLR